MSYLLVASQYNCRYNCPWNNVDNPYPVFYHFLGQFSISFDEILQVFPLRKCFQISTSRYNGVLIRMTGGADLTSYNTPKYCHAFAGYNKIVIWARLQVCRDNYRYAVIFSWHTYRCNIIFTLVLWYC